MRLRGRDRNDLVRREPRSDAFRSKDLVKVLREGFGQWLKAEGFKRLGTNNWVQPHGDDHLIVAVQCRQSGWDPRAGNSFTVEFERSRTPTRATGFSRQRLWGLLDEMSRREALKLNNQVAQTLPPPDQRFLSELPEEVREHYLRSFAPTTATVDSTDVWFNYYDETDAAVWADFMARKVEPTLRAFTAQPPSFFGHRPSSPRNT